MDATELRLLPPCSGRASGTVKENLKANSFRSDPAPPAGYRPSLRRCPASASRLFKAQGFPPDYQIEMGDFDGDLRPLTKTAQVRMCGNSVCPPIAAALVGANCMDMAAADTEAAA